MRAVELQLAKGRVYHYNWHITIISSTCKNDHCGEAEHGISSRADHVIRPKDQAGL